MAQVTIKTALGDVHASVEEGVLAADVVLGTGVLFDRPCAGRGVCGKCRMRIEGGVSEPTSLEHKHLGEEALASGLRLACQTRILSAAVITVSAEAISTDKIFRLAQDPESLVGPLGLAIDLGSTTVAAFLVTLADGRVHAGHAVLNRQSAVGAEVISRLLAAQKDGDRLRGLAWQSIQEAIDGLRLSARVRGRVEKAIVVGNTAMHHLALGLPVEQLMRSPFAPSSLDVFHAEAELLGAGFNNKIVVRFPPVIGGFAGSDALACLLYFGLEEAAEPAAVLDLGTNGEVMVTDGRRILVASTAAGPAFEGVNIACGMRAGPGAITALKIAEQARLRFQTIDDQRPRGIAGSGLLSIVRAFRDEGLIQETGRLVQDHPRWKGLVTSKNGGKSIRLTKDVYLDQADIRELQKAKAAIRAACEILLSRLNLKAGDLRRVFLTGSFGGKLDVEDTLALGVIPPLPAGRIQSLSNGAGLGAAMMLSEETFARAVKLARKAEHVELNIEPEFMDRYISGMRLSPGHEGAGL